MYFSSLDAFLFAFFFFYMPPFCAISFVLYSLSLCIFGILYLYLYYKDLPYVALLKNSVKDLREVVHIHDIHRMHRARNEMGAGEVQNMGNV